MTEPGTTGAHESVYGSGMLWRRPCQRSNLHFPSVPLLMCCQPPPKNSPACTLCGENQSLLHVLNNFATARDLRHNNAHHNSVLQEIASAVKPHLSPKTTLSVDIGDGYRFPCHIVPTDLRPDTVCWDTIKKSVCFAELTLCFEKNFGNG